MSTNLLKFLLIAAAAVSISGKVLNYEVRSNKDDGLWRPPTTVEPFTGSTKDRLWTPPHRRVTNPPADEVEETTRPSHDDESPSPPDVTRFPGGETDTPSDDDASPSPPHVTRRPRITRKPGLPWLPTKSPVELARIKPLPVKGESVVDGLKFPRDPVESLLRNKRAAVLRRRTTTPTPDYPDVSTPKASRPTRSPVNTIETMAVLFYPSTLIGRLFSWY